MQNPPQRLTISQVGCQKNSLRILNSALGEIAVCAHLPHTLSNGNIFIKTHQRMSLLLSLSKVGGRLALLRGLFHASASASSFSPTSRNAKARCIEMREDRTLPSPALRIPSLLLFCLGSYSMQVPANHWSLPSRFALRALRLGR